MKDVQGTKLTFTSGGLSSLSDGERKILYIFGAISNKLKLLQTQSFAYWTTARDESRPEHARAAAMYGILESLISLAGELKEAWESIQTCYYGTQVSKTLHPELPELVRDSLKRCGGHFAATGLVAYLRNNFASHNDADEPMRIAKMLPPEAEHSFFFFPDVGKYFDYSTKARLFAIGLHLKMADWDWSKIIQTMVLILMKGVYQDVYFALNGILAQVLTKVKLDKEPVEEKSVPKWNELSGHYYMYIEQSDITQVLNS